MRFTLVKLLLFRFHAVALAVEKVDDFIALRVVLPVLLVESLFVFHERAGIHQQEEDEPCPDQDVAAEQKADETKR